MSRTGYIGRFAPSPSGPLHAGSLVAALASWLDARAWNGGRGGRWLVRIEDLDTARNVPGAASLILRQLQDVSLLPDEAPVFQSQRIPLYQQAIDRLRAAGYVYPCGCSRKNIATELERLGHTRPRHGELIYPGTCRDGLHGKPALGWRFRTDQQPAEGLPQAGAPAPSATHWIDRRLGPQLQDVSAEVGDFIVLRADGPFAYQLAVVADDAAQQVTHVVRGEDLTDNTARQLLIHGALGLQAPQYLHTPLVLGDNGEKLSKQNGATALDTRQALVCLNQAASTLGLPRQQTSVADALATWVAAWRPLYNPVL